MAVPVSTSSFGSFGRESMPFSTTWGNPPDICELRLKQADRYETLSRDFETITRQISAPDSRSLKLYTFFLLDLDVFQGEILSRDHDVARLHLKQAVHRLLKVAGTENWDGEGAFALSPRTVEMAQRVIDTFPTHVETPDIAATPHGEVDFDWYVDGDTMLTVSVGPSGEIAFAGLFRDARVRGSEPWTGVLSPFIRCCFERLRDLRKGT